MTRADSIPPLGFPEIDSYSQDKASWRLPDASTCELTLYLPRGVTEEVDFRELMFDSLKGSFGFGKVYISPLSPPRTKSMFK